MDNHFIQIDHIRKSFGDQPVFEDVSLHVTKGESIAIIGQSGCGKSVLLKHILKLIEPDDGKIEIDGNDLQKLNESELTALRRRIGMLFQSAALFDSMTVAENVGLGLRESRLYSHDEVMDIVKEKLQMVGLTDAIDKSPAELSGGMRKRVGMARAIAGNPELMLYDEPTTGLDPITSDRINNLIVDLNDQLHVTSVTVTHDLKSASKIADRIVMLYNGRVQFSGNPQEIQATDDPVVRQFIAGSAHGPIQV
jgi:phospholipid/cholesterol/gamma-HCH transport system ATP-binding protein